MLMLYHTEMKFVTAIHTRMTNTSHITRSFHITGRVYGRCHTHSAAVAIITAKFSSTLTVMCHAHAVLNSTNVAANTTCSSSVA
jgi:hypothetical protein